MKIAQQVSFFVVIKLGPDIIMLRIYISAVLWNSILISLRYDLSLAIIIHAGHFGGYLHDPLQVSLWDYISIVEGIINIDMLLSVTDLYAIYGWFLGQTWPFW